MPNLPDIEKSTVSVRTLIVCGCALISACFMIMSGGVTTAWWTARQVDAINDKFIAIQALLDQHSGSFNELSVKTDQISARQDEIKTYVTAQLDARALLVKPTRWTYQMQQEFDRELSEHFENPTRHPWPDVQKIHDELIGLAP